MNTQSAHKKCVWKWYEIAWEQGVPSWDHLLPVWSISNNTTKGQTYLSVEQSALAHPLALPKQVVHTTKENTFIAKKNSKSAIIAFADRSSLHPMLPYGARLYGLHEFKCFYYPPLYHEFLVVCCLHLIPDLLTSQRLGIDFVVNRRFISVPLFSYFLFSVYLWIVCGIVFLWSWRKWWAHIFRGLRTTAGILKSGYSYFMKCNVLWECKSSVRTLFFLNLVTLGCSLFIIAFSLAKAIKKYFV